MKTLGGVIFENSHFGFEQVVPTVEPNLIGTLRLGVWRELFRRRLLGRNDIASLSLVKFF